jgi:Na+:H+ antiporter, NhaA family
LQFDYLLLAGGLVLLLLGCNRMGIRNLWLYVLGGVVLWYCVLQSGVHATIAGVLLALTIPNKSSTTGSETGTSKGQSPLLRLEHILKDWVAFGIMPLFALANAGVSLGAEAASHLLDPITLGIVFGLFLGKQIGVLGSAWLFVRMGWAQMPSGVTWRMIYGVACLAGIGFTMALFVAELAFGGTPQLGYAKVGILGVSVLSGVYGVLILRNALRPRAVNLGGQTSTS